jgi:hypothetical protein
LRRAPNIYTNQEFSEGAKVPMGLIAGGNVIARKGL